MFQRKTASGIPDFLGSAICFVLDFLGGPRRGIFTLVHAPYCGILRLLRAAFHRPRGVFDPLFDLVGRVPHDAAPCCVGSLRVAHSSAPERYREGAARAKATVPSRLSSHARSSKNNATAPPHLGDGVIMGWGEALLPGGPGRAGRPMQRLLSE